MLILTSFRDTHFHLHMRSEWVLVINVHDQVVVKLKITHKFHLTNTSVLMHALLNLSFKGKKVNTNLRWTYLCKNILLIFSNFDLVGFVTSGHFGQRFASQFSIKTKRVGQILSFRHIGWTDMGYFLAFAASLAWIGESIKCVALTLSKKMAFIATLCPGIYHIYNWMINAIIHSAKLLTISSQLCCCGTTTAVSFSQHRRHHKFHRPILFYIEFNTVREPGN